MSMNQELAQKLREAGFPEITRTAKELNLMRYRPMIPPDAPSFPFLQELLAEVPDETILVKGESGWATCIYDIGVWIGEKEYADTPSNRENGYAGKKYNSGYIDTGNTNFEVGETPEEALAKLWLKIAQKESEAKGK